MNFSSAIAQKSFDFVCWLVSAPSAEVPVETIGDKRVETDWYKYSYQPKQKDIEEALVVDRAYGTLVRFQLNSTREAQKVTAVALNKILKQNSSKYVVLSLDERFLCVYHPQKAPFEVIWQVSLAWTQAKENFIKSRL